MRQKIRRRLKEMEEHYRRHCHLRLSPRAWGAPARWGAQGGYSQALALVARVVDFEALL
jgi:hypothetical protein